MSLPDNGSDYTGRFHDQESAYEVNLRALGVRTINSAPFHPQNCGKVEQFRPRRSPSLATPSTRSAATSTCRLTAST